MRQRERLPRMQRSKNVKEADMTKKNATQVIACGASAVIVDENGNTIASIDMLINAMKRLFSKSARREGTSLKPATAHL